MFPARRSAALFLVAIAIVIVALWRRPAPAQSTAAEPARDAAPAAMASAAQPPAGGKTDAVQSAAPQPATGSPATCFGAHGPVALADIPAGRFRRALEQLTPEARERALRQLGDQKVPRNDVASLHVDRRGRLSYRCAPPEMPGAAGTGPTPATTRERAAALSSGASVPISSPPIRHSKPGSPNVIYLDFNGHSIVGTAWNEEDGTVGDDDYTPAVGTYVTKPYNTDGDAANFSDSEQAAIVEIWSRVAEDFAPFDVDVTTEQPATFPSSNIAHVLITSRKAKDGQGQDVDMPSAKTAAGIAFKDVFGFSDFATYSPALVYYDPIPPAASYYSPTDVADIASHETGHYLSLSHDGTTEEEYYKGHGGTGPTSWGPIMGAPYTRAMSQWSKGEYYHANNFEDDLARIAGKLGYRYPDGEPSDPTNSVVAGNTTALSASGSNYSGSGMMDHPGDFDRFSFTTTGGNVSFTIKSYLPGSSSDGTNLDVAVELWTTNDVLVNTDNENSPTVSFTQAVNPGTYYLIVKAYGTGDPWSSSPYGYTNYGSLGEYTITGSVSPSSPPSINYHPTSTTTVMGQTATFSTSAYGTPAPTYRWQRLPAGSGTWADLSEGTPYTGTTSNYLSVYADSLAASGDQFRCVVTNIGGSVTTSAATLTVQAATAPSIGWNPSNAATTVGTAAGFGCGAGYQSSGPLTYRWERQAAGAGDWTTVTNGTAYSGATTSYLTVNSPTLAMDGDKFRCVISNIAGSVTSSTATLTVTPVVAPVISNLPATMSVAYGDSLYLYPGISGTWPITFQWYYNDQPIQYATYQYFSRSGNTTANSGKYTLKATNGAGTATASVQVTVGEVVGLTVTQPPASVEAVKGTSVSFSIAVSGSQPITYQWRRNGVPLAYGTYSYYSISSVTPADAGDYTVVVTNDAGSITSSAATLTVLPPELPKITGWPSGATISATSGLYLYASVSGAGSLTYQWFKDGVAIPGATGYNYYNYNNLTAAAAGVYTLQVSNEAGTVVSPDLVVTWSSGTSSLPWLSARRQGDIVYFLLVTPGRILRYDLAQETWLPVTYLSETKVPTAFLPTAEGVFIAYNKELARRTLDLQGETSVATSTSPINGLFAVGDLIYFREGDYYTSDLRSFNRTTFAAGPVSNPGPYAFLNTAGNSPVIYSPLAGQIFTTRPGLSPNDVERFTVASDGLITSNGDSPYHGDFSIGNTLVLFADESKLITTAGIMYSIPDLNYVGSVGTSFDDVTFMADGSLVALRGRKLMAHAAGSGVETGRVALATDGAALFQRSDKLFVFGPPASGSTPAVQKVTASAFAAPTVPTPGSPVNKKISLDGVFLDANRVVNIVSRGEQGIVRWDTSTRRFLPTLPLRGRPYLSSYAPAFDRLVMSYSDGSLSDIFPTSAPTEEVFGNYPASNAPFGLVAMDDLLAMNIHEAESSGDLRLVLGSQGEVKYLSTSSYWTPFDLWVSSARRLYSLSNNYYSDGATYLEVPSTGELTGATGSTNTAFTGPMRPNAEGTLLLSTNGKVFNADLQQAGTLGNKIADGAWLSDAIVTIRVRPEGTQVQKWARITYELLGQTNLPGIPQRIFRLDDSNLLVITTADGYLVFNLISSTLETVASVPNDPAYPPARPVTFDANGYLANNSDIAAAIGNVSDRADKAWAHYWKYGMAEGRTDGDFNVQAYLTQYPNLKTQFGDDLRAAALHWYTIGRQTGLRIPAGFDVAGYFARNQDIAAGFANDKYGAWLHYYNYGVFEGRSFDANFIPAEYLELNQDLKAAGGGNLQGAVMHWLSWGHPVEDRMGRVPIGFNVDNYLARYPDLAAGFAGVTPTAVRNVAVWKHYLAYGTLEGRSDGDFEAYNYLATNPDLAAVFGNDIRGAALHWYFYGRREGRRIPGGFDVRNYRTLYPDLVVFAGDDLYGCWLHYRDVGVYEGRIYDDKFRPAEYLAMNPDIAAVVGNNYRDALLHWLYYGQFEGRHGKL